MQIRTLSGHDVLERLGPRLDELHAATGAPVTARRPWLDAWVRSHPAYEPLALAAEGAGQRLEGAALLARRKLRLFTEFVPLGARQSDQIRIPARTPAVATRLARAMIDLLRSAPGAWSLVVRHLPANDAVAAQLAAELPGTELAVGDASPTLRFRAGRALRAYVSKNHHQQVRRMLNRMRSEDLHPHIEHVREHAAIAALMPEVEAVCLERDVELRGQSFLERGSAGTFFRRVILAHAERGEVELTTLRLRGQLAAYVVCYLDGGAYRMWNCRMAPAWSRYGAGRVANNAALEHALGDANATEFDWMRGAEPYKLSMSNHVEHALDLRAWSTPALRLALDSSRRLKGLVKGVVSGHDWLRPALEATRRLKAAGRRGKRAVVLTIRQTRG